MKNHKKKVYCKTSYSKKNKRLITINNNNNHNNKIIKSKKHSNKVNNKEMDFNKNNHLIESGLLRKFQTQQYYVTSLKTKVDFIFHQEIILQLNLHGK